MAKPKLFKPPEPGKAGEKKSEFFIIYIAWKVTIASEHIFNVQTQDAASCSKFAKNTLNSAFAY